MKQKYLALALSAVFATALAGCGSDDDSNYQPQLPDTENPDNGGETPDNGGETPDNGGETPDNGGETPDNGGETPDNGGETPDGEGDVVGDAEDNVGDAATDPNADKPTVGGQQYVRGSNAKFDRELNPTPADSGNATVLNSKNIQNKKLDNIVLGRETVDRKGVKESFLRYSGEAVDGFSDKSSAETQGLQEYNVDNGIDVTSTDNTLNGLVSIDRSATNGVYTVEGQENSRASIGYNADGSTTSTRIFGNKYRDVNNTAEFNSARFVGATKADNTLDISSLDDDTKAFENIKLNNVQYGRVTSNIDKLEEGALQDNIKYYEAQVVNKGGNDTVDTYFYRGTGETSIDQMNALQEKGGKFDYAGSALMYGIDNSYHGDLGSPDSNSFGGTDLPVAGKGNFVKATVDMDTRKVSGNVFNVWEVTPNESNSNVFRQDNVVDFKGDIFGNTVKGDANLSYKEDSKGVFKGSFFGKNAEELGGSLNSIEKGYGNAAWGGVFGANKVVAPTVTPPTPEDGNANQTE
ncbi:transferrin-binding protein-like solute binding protein [Psychrobacter celer]|uniref:transferrin-binding protein-like solute binding protein n=1 Tax=Psychrobacter celer TaxID=306572 RepID=UPI003FD23514